MPVLPPLSPVVEEVLKGLDLGKNTKIDNYTLYILVQEICAAMIARTKFIDNSPIQITSLTIDQASGDCCKECGSFKMVRTGTCLTCQNCGSSSGGCG